MMSTNGKLVLKYRTQLMGIAALLIYVSHIWNPVLTEVPVIGQVELFIKNTGYSGVDLFFFLSGVGLNFAIDKGTVFGFYSRRLKNILIPFWATGVAYAIVKHWTFRQLIANITGYSFVTESMYSYLWFVPAIAILYLLFPLYYWLFKKSRNKLFFTLFVLEVWWVVTMRLGGILRADLYGFTNRIPVFLLGVLFGYYCKEKCFELTLDHLICMVSTLSLGIILLYMCVYSGFYILVPISGCCLPPLLIAISGLPLLAFLFEQVSKMKYIRAVGKGVNKVLTFYGSISLELYCVQELIGNPVNLSLTESSNRWLINGILLIVITLAGYILHYVNKGFWHLIQRIVVKRKMICSNNCPCTTGRL